MHGSIRLSFSAYTTEAEVRRHRGGVPAGGGEPAQHVAVLGPEEQPAARKRIGGKVFHAMENFFRDFVEKSLQPFPWCGKKRPFFHSVENFFPRCGKLQAASARACGVASGMGGVGGGAGAGGGALASAEAPALERLAIWCEFMPYAEVQRELPVLAKYGCDLILHVERESFADPDFAKLLRAAERAGVGVDAWLLLPYEEHLYVGQASVGAVRALARQAADYFEKEELAVRAFVFDCEPSPLLGRELFEAVLAKSPRQLARTLRDQMDPEVFGRDVAEINGLIAELRGRGYAVDGAGEPGVPGCAVAGERGAGGCAECAGERGGVGCAVVHHVPLHGEPAVVCGDAEPVRGAGAAAVRGAGGDGCGADRGLHDIPENAERAALFGGGDMFYGYLRGMRSAFDLEEAVGVVLGCGVRRVNLYALDGAATSVAGTENWLKAARRARPLGPVARWTPARSLQYAALGSLTEKSFRWMTGRIGEDAWKNRISRAGRWCWRAPALGGADFCISWATTSRW
jgi:hypothetical protein